MPSHRDEIFVQIKQVEVEYDRVRFAVDLLYETIRHDPSRFGDRVKPKELQAAAENLEATYFIRLFAEFEAALRRFWRDTLGTIPPTRTRDLIDSIGARRNVAGKFIQFVHEVREYRNHLVHFEEPDSVPVNLAEARSRLCRLVSFLPPHW